MQSGVDLDDALGSILAGIDPVRGSQCVTLDAALGRILAENLDAPMSLPPFRSSAMDGYALASADAVGPPPHQLPIAGTSFAGRPLQSPIPRGACVRIFTGAAVPEHLDSVVIQEDCRRDGESVIIDVPVTAGDNVRPIGQDVAAGSRLMNAGRLLGPFDVGWLAACGLTSAPVRARAKIGLFSNGDELAESGQPLRPGQIYDANRIALRALLEHLPVEIRDYGIVPDDPEHLRAVLLEADACCDAVITSGGVSVGDADWVKAALHGIGRLHLWKLNLKPGKPLAYGRLRNAVFFGLPGNPVSALVTTMMLVTPAIERLCGGEPAAPLAVSAALRGSLQHRPGREEFMRGTLSAGEHGLEVSVTGDQSSNRLASFALANCLIRIPKGCGNLEDGDVVSVLPFRGLVR